MSRLSLPNRAQDMGASARRDFKMGRDGIKPLTVIGRESL